MISNEITESGGGLKINPMVVVPETTSDRSSTNDGNRVADGVGMDVAVGVGAGAGLGNVPPRAPWTARLANMLDSSDDDGDIDNDDDGDNIIINNNNNKGDTFDKAQAGDKIIVAGGSETSMNKTSNQHTPTTGTSTFSTTPKDAANTNQNQHVKDKDKDEEKNNSNTNNKNDDRKNIISAHQNSIFNNLKQKFKALEDTSSNSSVNNNDNDDDDDEEDDNNALDKRKDYIDLTTHSEKEIIPKSPPPSKIILKNKIQLHCDTISNVTDTNTTDDNMVESNNNSHGNAKIDMNTNDKIKSSTSHSHNENAPIDDDDDDDDDDDNKKNMAGASTLLHQPRKKTIVDLKRKLQDLEKDSSSSDNENSSVEGSGMAKKHVRKRIYLHDDDHDSTTKNSSSSESEYISTGEADDAMYDEDFELESKFYGQPFAVAEMTTTASRRKRTKRRSHKTPGGQKVQSSSPAGRNSKSNANNKNLPTANIMNSKILSPSIQRELRFQRTTGLLEREETEEDNKMNTHVRSQLMPHPVYEFDPGRKLYWNRCRKCVMCIKPTCGKCSSCVWNYGDSTRYPRVCWRKMCETISVNDKKQPAKGLPDGWYFYFVDPNTLLSSSDKKVARSASNQFKTLQGLVVLSPRGKSFYDFHNEYGLQKMDMNAQKDFYQDLGADLLVQYGEHPYVGHPCQRNWIRVDGSIASIFGTVTRVEEDIVDRTDVFTVAYNHEVYQALNDSSHCQLKIEKMIAPLDGNQIWDGVHRAYEKAKLTLPSELKIKSQVVLERWFVPDAYTRSMVPVETCNGRAVPGYLELPAVTMLFRGYLLSFQVSESTVPEAGFGVFLSISKQFKSSRLPNTFRLNAGELLDFGIYAPFCLTDIQGDGESLVKSIVLGGKHEAYSFRGKEKDTCLDITDINGDLHMTARKHVTPFVNEIMDPETEIPVVHARTDPEGGLHYLLGHSDGEEKPFLFRADGKPREIFIDYGSDYESVRIREGYPRKAMSKKQRQAFLEKEEREYLDDLDFFSANDVDRFVRDYMPIVTTVGGGGGSSSSGGGSGYILAKSTLLRLISVAIMMRRRAVQIRSEFLAGNKASSFVFDRNEEVVCDNGATTLDLDVLVNQCHRLLVDGCCAIWRGWYGMSTLVEEGQKCFAFRYVLQKAYPTFNFEEGDLAVETSTTTDVAKRQRTTAKTYSWKTSMDEEINRSLQHFLCSLPK